MHFYEASAEGTKGNLMGQMAEKAGGAEHNILTSHALNYWAYRH